MTRPPIRGGGTLGPRDVVITPRADGAQLLRNPHALAAYPDRLTDRFAHWAAVAPDQHVDRAARRFGGWRKISYAEGYDLARRIGQASSTASSRRSGRSRSSPSTTSSTRCSSSPRCTWGCRLDQSSAYSLVSTDHAKLRFVLGGFTPRLLGLAADGEAREGDSRRRASSSRSP